MRRSIGFFVAGGVATCLFAAMPAAQLPPDPRVVQALNACQGSIAIAVQACRAERDRVVTAGSSSVCSSDPGQYEILALVYVKEPQRINEDLVITRREMQNPAYSAAGLRVLEADVCIMQTIQRLPSPSPAKPVPAPAAAPTPRPSVPPAPNLPNLEEARLRVTQGYKDAIDDVLADLDRVPAMRKNAPPPPKGAAEMKDRNTRGEDAVECMSVHWPVNPGQQPRLQNHCAFPVEALWCVMPCGKRAGNMWTIYPGNGNYDGYPIQGTENAAGRSSVIWFGACKGRNSIGGSKVELGYTCSPPH